MADLAELNLIVRSQQVNQAARSLGNFDSKAKQVDRSAQRLLRTNARLNTSFERMRGFILRTVAALGLLAAGASTIRLAAEFERTEIAMRNLTGSAEQTTKILTELEEFSARTPFLFKDLAQSTRLMLALGFAAEDVVPIMRTLGDAVAALGGGADLMNRVVIAIGQIRSKGKVTFEEMRQLAEAGIPAIEILAEKLGVTVPQAMDLIERRAVGVDGAIRALLEGIEERFAGATDDLARTTSGRFSTLIDNLQFTLRDIGLALFEAFQVPDALSTITVVIREIGMITIDVIRVLSGLETKFDGTADTARKLADVVKVLGAAFVVLVGIKIVQFLAAATLGLVAFTKAAFTANVSLASTTTLLSALAVAVAAFEFGSFLQEEFRIVREAATVVASFLFKTFERIKFAWMALVDIMGELWTAMIAGLQKVFAGFLRFVESAVRTIEGVVNTGSALFSDTLKRLGFDADEFVTGETSSKLAALANKVERSIKEDNRTLGERIKSILDENGRNLAIQVDAIEKAEEKILVEIAKEFGNRSRKTGQSFLEFATEDIVAQSEKLLGGLSEALGSQFEGAINDLLAKGRARAALDEFFEGIGDPARAGVKPEDIVANLSGELDKLAGKAKGAKRPFTELIQKLEQERQSIFLSTREREFNERVVKAQIAAQREFGDNQDMINMKMADFRQRLRDLQGAQQIEEVARGIGDSFGNAFTDIINGTKSVTDAFEGMLNDIFNLILKQTVTQPLANLVTSAIGGLAGGGGGGGGLLGSLFGGLFSAKGNVFAGGNVVPFQRGGIINSPIGFPLTGGRLGIAGEAGPEAIVPLQRDAQGRLGVTAAGGGGAGSVVVNVINNSAEPVSTDQRATAGGKEITVQIGEAMARDVATNGPLGRTISQVFGVRRRGANRG